MITHLKDKPPVMPVRRLAEPKKFAEKRLDPPSKPSNVKHIASEPVSHIGFNPSNDLFNNPAIPIEQVVSREIDSREALAEKEKNQFMYKLGSDSNSKFSGYDPVY